MSIFTSSRNRHIGPSVEGTPDDMAYNMAIDAIAHIKHRRLEALKAEQAAEPSIETTQEDKEQYEVLDALMKGKHRAVVVPLVLEAFPELLVPENMQ